MFLLYKQTMNNIDFQPMYSPNLTQNPWDAECSIVSFTQSPKSDIKKNEKKKQFRNIDMIVSWKIKWVKWFENTNFEMS